MDSFQSNIDRVARNLAIWQQGLRSFDALSSKDQLLFASMFNPWVNHLEQVLRMRERDLGR